jgi:hypothetical protein
MHKASIPVGTVLLAGLLTACGGNSVAALPGYGTRDIPIPATATSTQIPSVIPDASTETPTATPPPTQTATPTLAPDAWEFLPVIPAVNDTTRRIFLAGQDLNNDLHAFSIVGDCLSLPLNLFGNFGRGANHYNLGAYGDLQPAIDWFAGSFTRQSVTLGDGFNTAAVLSPLRADPQQCRKSETPLVCEYRLQRPSFALIALGTDDYLISPETYEQRMRQIVEYTISNGIIPILATKADNREGNNAFNRIVARLAYEYDVPLWNFWAAVQSLPQQGVANDRGHLTWADPNRLDADYSMQFAVPVRTVTALQTLDSIWRGLIGP